MYTIYALCDPHTKNVRYVGYTSRSLDKRLNDHWSARNCKRSINNYKNNWIRSLQQKPIILAIEGGIENHEYAILREVYWISQYSKLTNGTSGGEVRKIFTEQVRLKISRTRKRKYASGEIVNYYKGKKNPISAEICRNMIWTKEIRKKVSDARKRYIANDPGNHKARKVQKCIRVNQLTMEGELVKTWSSIREAIIEGFDRAAVTRCCKGRHKYHKGFKWEYADNF